MANKHIKNCSTLVIMEMQVKVTPAHYPHIKMVDIQRPGILSADKDAEQLEHCWQEGKMVQSLWKTFWQLLRYHIVIIRPSSTPPKYYFPKRNENMFTQKTMHEHL